MRVTSSMYYKNIYNDSSRMNEKLFDVNKQISSGLKIQYADEDVSVFTETMRLDNEITSLGQVKESTDSAFKVSTQSDTVLNEFETTMDRVKTLLVQAASSTQSNTSLDAISGELRGLEKHLRNLSNTSINGKYVFSGSAINIKPISDNGIYMGNNDSLNAFLGSNTEQQYNLTGSELFLGEEILVKRQVTANVAQYNLSSKYPDFTDPTSIDQGVDKIPINSSNTIRDLMGDIDNVTNSATHFYLRGTQSDGTSFKKQISMNDSETVGELLTQIGNAYGNTSDLNVVNVSLNNFGEIVIEDKLKGSSKLEFHMAGAVDYDLTNNADMADVNDSVYGANAGNINNLSAGETNFDKIINGTSSATESKLHVKNFVQSTYSVVTETPKLISSEFSMDRSVVAGDTLSITVDNGDSTTTAYTQAFNIDAATTYDDLKNQIELNGNFSVTVDNDNIKFTSTTLGFSNGVSIDTNLVNDDGSTTGAVSVTTTTLNSSTPTGDSALVYDRTSFTKDGSKVTGSTPQILNGTNAFATASTKISQVADLSQVAADTLAGTQFTLSGNDVNGKAYTAQIDFKNTASGGSTFSLDGGVTNYNIFDLGTPRVAVNADDMTYQQLLDVMNMVLADSIPATNTEDDYDSALKSSKNIGNSYLTYDGKIEFKDELNSDTRATVAIYDSDSGSFSATKASSVMTFNSNNALTIRDPKTDFFKELDQIITAVEDHDMHPDGKNGSSRNIGIQNSILKMDDLKNHVSRSHAVVGAQSNSLANASDRAQLLEVSAMTLRSSIVDTDIAEASLTLTQLSLNLQAMYSTVSKISQLSLVNYL